MSEDRAPGPVIRTGRALLRRLARSPCRPGLRMLAGAGLLPAAIWRRLPAEGELRVALGGSGEYRYASDTLDQIGRALLWRGALGYEPETARLVRHLAPAVRVFVDVGAHTGPYTLLVAAAAPRARITAFEPLLAVRERLVANLALNGWLGRCEVRTEALSDRTGTATLYVPAGERPTSASLVVGGYRGLSASTRMVPCARLDDVYPAPLAVDLLKIDAEGHDDAVLRGAKGLLGRAGPIVIVECNPDGPVAGIEAALAPLDYALFEILPGALRPREHLRPDPSQRHRNWCAIPRRRLRPLAPGDGPDRALDRLVAG